MSDAVSDVCWKKTLSVRVMRQSAMDETEREDWAYVEKKGESITLFLGEDEERLTLSRNVIEAIYDIHQEIPR